MKKRIEKGRMLKVPSNWICFVLSNPDMMSCINGGPLVIRRDTENTFSGGIFGFKVALEIMSDSRQLSEGQINIVADAVMPLRLGHSHAVVHYRYHMINSESTMVDMELTIQTRGIFFGTYFKLFSQRIESYLDNAMTKNEQAAQRIIAEDDSINKLLSDEQIKRIIDFKNTSTINMGNLPKDNSAFSPLKDNLLPDRTWDAELRELCQLYKGFDGKASLLHQELERIQETRDAVATLLICRRMLEVIVTQMCESLLKRPRGTEPMASIIDRLDKIEHVPDYVFTSMRNLNRLSTYGAHPKDFSPRQVRESLIALCSIMEWYVSDSNKILYEQVEGESKEKAHNTKVDEYKSLCRGAWLDGVVNECERKLLEEKRIELGFSEEEAQKIESEFMQ